MPSVPAVPTVQCPLLPVKTLVEAEERRLLAQLLGVALVAVLEHQTRPRHAPVTHHTKLGRSCFYQPQHCNCSVLSVRTWQQIGQTPVRGGADPRTAQFLSPVLIDD